MSYLPIIIYSRSKLTEELDEKYIYKYPQWNTKELQRKTSIVPKSTRKKVQSCISYYKLNISYRDVFTKIIFYS